MPATPSVRRCALSAVAGFFALGLMSKPMLVTVPFVLLLLDYWPLERFGTRPAHVPVEASSWFGRLPAVWRLVVEKIPLLALAAASCGIVLATHSPDYGPTTRSIALSLAARLANALVSYAAYVGQSFCPIDMVPYYPIWVLDLPMAWVVGSLVLLVAITAWRFTAGGAGPICWSAGCGFWECWCRSAECAGRRYSAMPGPTVTPI